MKTHIEKNSAYATFLLHILYIDKKKTKHWYSVSFSQ